MEDNEILVGGNTSQLAIEDSDELDLLILIDVIANEERTRLQDHIKEQQRLCRRLPADKTRPTWTGFCNRVSDSHFRKQFRMSRNAFSNLCSTLSAAIGDATFRPESSLASTRNSASLQSRGGLIPGEVKVAISIRFMAGGSHLDLMPLFYVSVPHMYNIFDQFLNWVLKALDFPLARYIQEENWTALAAIAEPLSYGSNGVLGGILGPLDGLAIRIRSPTLTEVADPGNYFCRKGFFALNVQAICDRMKKFLWCYTSNKGSTHDSVAFTNSRFYSLLTEKAAQLEEKGFYLIGDSAYNLTHFLLVPYSTEEVRADRSDMCDAFNFYLSSSRIHIECAFGELVMRWRILWRTLQYDLVKCQRIVQVCMLLHNFIKDKLAKESDGACNNTNESDWLPSDDSREEGGERAFPLVSDNNERYNGGRRTQTQEVHLAKGEILRRSLTIQLQRQGLRRPMHSGMKYNAYGHVFFDG